MAGEALPLTVLEESARPLSRKLPSAWRPCGTEAQDAWLHSSAEEAFACLTPYSDELTPSLDAAHKVSSRVNSPKNNDAGLVEEVDENAQ